MHQEESGLAQRLRSRDEQAMAELYDRYARRVYFVIHRQVNDRGTVEDLVQETFLRAWNHIHAFDAERGDLQTWLLAIARNRAIDYLRSLDFRFAQGAVSVDAAAPAPGCEAEIVRREQAGDIGTAVARLRPRHREVLELAFWEGLSHNEIAARLCQPLGTVKTWVRSALKVLRTEMA